MNVVVWSPRLRGASGRAAALAVCALVLALPVRAQAPSWTVNAAAFEQNMSVVASVTVNGTRLSSAGDRLAAFVGSEVRGVAVPNVVGGANVFFLPVYANAGGEAVTFKVYDAAANAVRDLTPGLTFASNSVQGSATAPLALAAGTTSGGGGTGGIRRVVRQPRGLQPHDERRRRAPLRRWIGRRHRRPRGGLRGHRGARRGNGRFGRRAGRCSFCRSTATPRAKRSRSRWPAAPTCAPPAPPSPSPPTRCRHARGAVRVGRGRRPGQGGSDVPGAWNVAPSAFDRSMNVVAALFTGGQRSTDPADRLVAFVGRRGAGPRVAATRSTAPGSRS